MTAAEDWLRKRQQAEDWQDLGRGNPFDKLVNIDTAANLIGVSPSTIHNWISRGYVDQYGQRSWVTGFHIEGVRRVHITDVLRADAAVERAARGGLRKRAM